MTAAKKIITYFVIVCVAFLAALNYQLFVFPNQFAPSGVNGICTMIQYVTGISVGYLSLLVNLPLAIWVYFSVSRPIALRSMLYVITFSLALIVLEKVDLQMFVYATENGTSKILGPLAAGIIMGFCYSVLIKASAYTGGTDFVSAIIHKHHPERSVFGITFTLNVIVAACSYFVYGYKMEPVLLCILYSFASTNMAERFLKNGRSAVRFEIITSDPDGLYREIRETIHHSATCLPGKGMYSGKETSVLVCVVNRTQAAVLSGIIRRHGGFAIMSQVNEVMGNFRNLGNDGREVVTLLDKGDGKTV